MVGGEQNMTLRRLIVLAGAIGAIALIVGIVGLLVSVSVSGANGDKIGCGNAAAADLSAAQEADNQNPANLPVVDQIVPHTTYVAECESAVSHQRAWAISLTVIGAIVVVGAVIVIFGSPVIPGRAGRLGAGKGGRPPMIR
jgi:hypothetical protein